MQERPHPVWSSGFWGCYWITMRPYLLFVSGTAGLAGLASGTALTWSRALLALSVFFFSYGFGQALTDCFQLDTDTLSSPYRPLVRGAIGRKQVLAVSLLGCGLCCLALTLLEYRTLIPAALCVFGLSTYTWFKRRWWGGPFYNAWIVALLPLMGMMIARGPEETLLRAAVSGIGPYVTLSVLFSYANFVLMGYLKDISADRASGYNTFPVTFGWKRTTVVSDGLAALSLATTAMALWKTALPGSGFTLSTLIPLAIYLLAAAALLAAQLGAHRTRAEDEAYRPIAGVVRGFVLLRLAETAAQRLEWTIWLIPMYMAFELVLFRRQEKSQV